MGMLAVFYHGAPQTVCALTNVIRPALCVKDAEALGSNRGEPIALEDVLKKEKSYTWLTRRNSFDILKQVLYEASVLNLEKTSHSGVPFRSFFSKCSLAACRRRA